MIYSIPCIIIGPKIFDGILRFSGPALVIFQSTLTKLNYHSSAVTNGYIIVYITVCIKPLRTVCW